MVSGRAWALGVRYSCIHTVFSRCQKPWFAVTNEHMCSRRPFHRPLMKITPEESSFHSIPSHLASSSFRSSLVCIIWPCGRGPSKVYEHWTTHRYPWLKTQSGVVKWGNFEPAPDREFVCTVGKSTFAESCITFACA